MRIEHVALYVLDLEKVKHFFMRFFGGRSNDKYSNLKTGFSSYFISFDDGSRLEIMTRGEVRKSENSDFSAGYNHIAFTVGNDDDVDRLTAELRENGFATMSGPRVTGDGYYESCVKGPEDILIELVSYSSR
jgi:lactoylglutathione lyase